MRSDPVGSLSRIGVRSAAKGDPVQLTPLQREILSMLGRLGFATGAQLAYWCRVPPQSVTRAARLLSGCGRVGVCAVPRPAIWCAGACGAHARVASVSWRLMAHVCHRNALEILLDRRLGGFRFLPRTVLLRQGFNPTHGEHAGIDGSGRSWLVLLDDIQMASARIGRTWYRRHTPSSRHWPDPAGRCWGEVMQRYVVACTDPDQAQRHRIWIAAHDVPVTVIDIPALWTA
ncbi:MAG: hypothetical protein M0Z84_01620 [Gammaproteobacteria bacterium]|nr:hypothetical protein [Gammaproteobacteria bacterium]